MSTSESTVLVTSENRVRTLTLNRPRKRNALDAAAWESLGAALRDFDQNEQDRVLVITGAEGHFCSGTDVTTTQEPRHPLAEMRRVADVGVLLHRIEKPTIALVRGHAAGAGCNLALACDLVVASTNAWFSEIFVRRGLSIDFGGSWMLPRLVGLHRAKELALLGDRVSSSEAAQLGLVNRALPDDEVDEFAYDWATRLADGPPVAMSLTKRLLNNAYSVTMEQALEDEGRAQAINAGTADLAEGFKAFVDRRPPRFTGRSLV